MEIAEQEWTVEEMTNKKAIELLRNLIGMVEDTHGNDYDEAFHMAIEALSKRDNAEPIPHWRGQMDGCLPFQEEEQDESINQ